MENMISVSKASKLLGISRNDLIDQLSAANIPTFEGKVDFERLKSIAPALSLCEAEILDRVRFIRENVTKGDRGSLRGLSKQELIAQVNKLSTDLMVEARSADHYEKILVGVAVKLGDLQSSENEEVRKIALYLCDWLREQITSE